MPLLTQTVHNPLIKPLIGDQVIILIGLPGGLINSGLRIFIHPILIHALIRSKNIFALSN